MREIKFRGKRKDNGEWVYGYYFCGYQKHSYVESKEYKHWIEGYDEKGHYFVYEVIPETVGQFTGLYDKNGKEIYEGDFVLLKGQKCLISFSETSGAWSISYPVRDDVDFQLEGLLYWWYYMGAPDIEVIGNIHDKE